MTHDHHLMIYKIVKVIACSGIFLLQINNDIEKKLTINLFSFRTWPNARSLFRTTYNFVCDAPVQQQQHHKQHYGKVHSPTASPYTTKPIDIYVVLTIWSFVLKFKIENNVCIYACMLC